MTEPSPDKQSPSGSADSSSSLAQISVLAPISVVVPTYEEAENLPFLIDRLRSLRETEGIDLELIIADDNSQDGTEELVRELDEDWVRLIVRKKDRGLSPSVIEGFQAARHPVLVCMDADLSHPPEKIPNLILALESGQELVIGSRYVPGASTDDEWGLGRWLNSRVATLMAYPLTKAKDPMAGFFALRRSDFESAHRLNPVGYKIALELIVKCGIRNVGEVPIHFTDRVRGESKLSFTEQLKYIQHLRRLYMHKFENAMYLLQFLTVGVSGLIVNLCVLTLLSLLGAIDEVALAGGVLVSLVTNFLLNRRFTFSYAREGNIWRQFAGFVAVSFVGLVVNYSLALTMQRVWLEDVWGGLQLAAIIGVAAGVTCNFIGNRFVVFKKSHVRKRAE